MKINYDTKNILREKVKIQQKNVKKPNDISKKTNFKADKLSLQRRVLCLLYIILLKKTSLYFLRNTFLGKLLPRIFGHVHDSDNLS